MYLPRWTGLISLTSCLLLLLPILTLAVDIKTHRTDFENQLLSPQYFPNSDVILIRESRSQRIWRSTNAGAEWDEVKLLEGTTGIWLHPWDEQVAIATSRGESQYITMDRGDSWSAFRLDGTVPIDMRNPFSFHSTDHKKVILNTQSHGFPSSNYVPYYTEDLKRWKPLGDNLQECIWAKEEPRLETRHEDMNNRILCLTPSKQDSFFSALKNLKVSDNFFRTSNEPDLYQGRPVDGVLNVASVKSFLVVAAKSEDTDELALYVSTDADRWHRAEFPDEHKLKEESFTILESTNHSLEMDVQTTRRNNHMGALFTSDSTGRYFIKNLDHTHRNDFGFVDYEKIQNIEGVILANIVTNPEDVERRANEEPRVASKISFDQGRTFQDLTVKGEKLHLHGESEPTNIGRVFSSFAPGVVLGIGNTGSSLRDYQEGDLYVSNDAGLTWSEALDGPHKYEFGDQGGVLIAAYDKAPTRRVMYSLNHGKTWDPSNFDDNDVEVGIVTTSPGSTTSKFLITAASGQGSKRKYSTYAMDFSSVYDRDCESDDFEEWYARLDKDGKPDCLMGHKQKFRRRKADAQCALHKEFQNPEPEREQCKCTKEDYECDFGFEPKDGKCVAIKTPDVKELCKDGAKTYKVSSGMRLIPGNSCNKESGEKLDEPTTKSCDGSDVPDDKAPSDGTITPKVHTFDGSSFKDVVYMERKQTSSGNDETILARTDTSRVYRSKDGGRTWQPILEDYADEIVEIVPHKFDNDAVFLLTSGTTHYLSYDRGDNFHDFETPRPLGKANGMPRMSFKEGKVETFIWSGAQDCDTESSAKNCHNVASITHSRGDSWETLARYTVRCEFVKKEVVLAEANLIYCSKYLDEDSRGPIGLFSSHDDFEKPLSDLNNILDYATYSEFNIVAVQDHKTGLRMVSTVDGANFAPADWPKDLDIESQPAYTVLDSSTHAIFLHVTVNAKDDQEYGHILKSNSNGTFFSTSLRNVNRNGAGYVDFEKMGNIEGVAIANVVENVDNFSGKKRLLSMITHNDGAQWEQIKGPSEDSEGKRYDCDGECWLHLHGYTERIDASKTYASKAPGAVALMLGTGNVGQALKQRSEADTFVSRDAGITWHTARKGTYMWEYGDQGSIIVLVKDLEPTKWIHYSEDEGKTWKDFQFADEEISISDITTSPSESGLRFILWERPKGSSEEKTIRTISIDVEGLRDRTCFLDSHDANAKDDYYLWTPSHPLQEQHDCLFGHVTQYNRKNVDAKCWNGQALRPIFSIERNCTCERQDFECDFNYERGNDGTCQLVKGFDPPNHATQCLTNPGQKEYFEPTGYRKIPISTCQGGRALDVSIAHACPGYQDEFDKNHSGLSGFAFFLVAIVLPFSVAGLIGWYVYRRWDGKIGQIRLGDDVGGMGQGSYFDASRPWVKYPVIVLSATVAVVAAVPMVLGATWRFVSGLWDRRRGAFTSRGSFARTRGQYVAVDEDEDDLLGGPEDEDV